MDTVILIGKTRKGKNRITELGAKRTVLITQDKVLFDTRFGPWILCESINKKNLVWVHITDDRDFSITK